MVKAPATARKAAMETAKVMAIVWTPRLHKLAHRFVLRVYSTATGEHSRRPPATAPRIAASSTPARSVAAQASTAAADQWHMAVLQDRVDQIIRAYRVRGHLVAQLDPLGFPRPALPELEPAFLWFHRRRFESRIFDRHDRRSAIR